MTAAFSRFRRALASLTGIALSADKQYLAESRLGPVMRAHGVEDFAQFARMFENRDTDALVRDAMDAMTTNETFFFRDRAPFDEFRERVVPALVGARAREKRLRIWCAACSTGQEAYSLAMTLDSDSRALRGWSVEILGTDLSRAAIETARRGVFSQFEVQRGLPTSYLLRYFHRHDGDWRVNEHLRARVAFREFNLMSDFRDLGRFDVVFCRNVLLYFEPETQRNMLARLAEAMQDDGYLFLGASETAADASPCFTPGTSDGLWRRSAAARPRLLTA